MVAMSMNQVRINALNDCNAKNALFAILLDGDIALDREFGVDVKPLKRNLFYVSGNNQFEAGESRDYELSYASISQAPRVKNLYWESQWGNVKDLVYVICINCTNSVALATIELDPKAPKLENANLLSGMITAFDNFGQDLPGVNQDLKMVQYSDMYIYKITMSGISIVLCSKKILCNSLLSSVEAFASSYALLHNAHLTRAVSRISDFADFEKLFKGKVLK